MLGEFRARGVEVVALSQEDPGLDEAPGILDGLDPAPTYPILVDIGRAASPTIARTTVYLVDEGGRVAQVFPMMTHMRATARTLLREIDRPR